MLRVSTFHKAGPSVAARIPDLINHNETACALDNLYFSVSSNGETQKTSVSKTDK